MSDTEKTEAVIKSIIANILKIKPEEINDVSSPRSIKGWVGGNHRKIIYELEKRFNIIFDQSEVDTLVNYKIIKSTVLAHIR